MTVAVAAPAPLWRDRHPVMTAAVVAGIAGLFGWAAALAGIKGMVAALAGLVFASALIVFKRREEIILATAVLSVGAMLHKSFGALAEVSSGPPSIYVSSFDVMIGLLWFSWFVMDPYGMAAELRAAVRRRVLYLPAIAMALMVPSVLLASDSRLAIAEVVRMTSMYFLFVYVALRVRTRLHVWIVLGALGAVGVIEAIVVLGQKLTTSSLGLSVFGTPTILHNRHDGIAVARPFGTMAHPVFMGAFVGGVAIVAYSLAVNLRSARLRWLWLGISGASVVPLVLSNTRAASLGIVIAFLAVSVAGMMTARLTPRVVGTALVVAAIALVPGWSYVSDLWSKSFKTEHFDLEWESRMQLNEVAIEMFEDAPFIGHGLNNFETAMTQYDRYGLIFADNPVHNVYLLQLAETGIVGFAGMAILVIGIARRALRLARSRDRLLSAVGFGVAGSIVFWGVEEALVFSLRQDHPRALLFLLAGLVVACGRLARAEPPRAADVAPLLPRVPAAPPRSRDASGRTHPGNATPGRRGRARVGRVRQQAHRRLRLTLQALVVVPAMAIGGSSLAFDDGAPADAIDTSDLRIVFQAIPRDGDGHRALYVANGDGTGVIRLTPPDGRDYSWGRWALGGTKIVYTARDANSLGEPEQVYLSDPDGSNVQQLTFNGWRNAQPVVSPDGRSIVFTSRWDEFREVGLFKLDLATLQVENLSAVTQESGAVDADPRFSIDGQRIVFAASKVQDGTFLPTEVALMDADGGNRRLLTDDSFYDTDPALSPDDQSLAISSYRGEGEPRADTGGFFQVKLHDFRLVHRTIATGTERVLTEGLRCAERPDTAACAPEQAPAYVPSWTPDGSGIGYVGILSGSRTCICVADPVTGDARPVLTSTSLAISWFDWVVPTSAPPTAVEPGSDLPTSRLLFGGVDQELLPVLAASGPDRWGQLRLAPDDPVGGARWSADRTRIVASVRVAPSSFEDGGPPDAPPGERRQRHYTIGFLRELFAPPIDRLGRESEQIVVMDGDGSDARLVTSPWTEDWRDAIPDGELRGNTSPDISPDGRYIVFTNLSTATPESFILRMDLDTGEVVNLTNATAGAVPVADMHPRFSPDGRLVAFATTSGGSSQIAVVDSDGYGYRTLTDDDHFNVAPAWSPDGRSIVYASYRGGGTFSLQLDAPEAIQLQLPTEGWVLVRVDVQTGEQTVLTDADASPVFQPVYSPDGSQIAFISLSDPGQPDIYVVDADGGRARPVQVTQQTRELFVDWK